MALVVPNLSFEIYLKCPAFKTDIWIGDGDELGGFIFSPLQRGLDLGGEGVAGWVGKSKIFEKCV